MKEINLNEFFEKYSKQIIIIFLILIFISRIYKFGTLPAAIGVDEAGAAYDAYALANYGVDRYLNSFPIYLINFGGGQSVLYAYLNALLIKLTGQDNILISRLPELLMFLMAIFVSYKLIEKKQDKKTAIVFAFLIIVCPWTIVQSRFGLDCLLLGPMFMIDLYLLENAKKNWQYIVAGISVGITLYSYSLSWLIMPSFLIVWVIYHLYTKTTTIKNVITLAVTVLIFAIPLILFLLVNMGVLHIDKIGPFTIPMLFELRAGEISILNVFAYGAESLYTIFLYPNTFYYFEIPFFVIGIIVGIKDIFETSKRKEYSLLSFMTLTFFTILITNLLVFIASTNKGNILYIPILYFTTIGIFKVIKNRKVLWIALIAIYFISFSIFEVNYYTNYSKTENDEYEDRCFTEALEYIDNEENNNKEIYIFTYRKAEPYIYALLHEKISPYEFDKTKKVEQIWADERNFVALTKQMGRYHFGISEIIRERDDSKMYIITKEYKEIADYFEKIGYQTIELEKYYIFK